MAGKSKDKDVRSLLKRPTFFQLALALTIIKTKPPGCLARECIVALRKHIKKRTADVRPNSESYIDQAAYWRERCRRAEVQLNARDSTGRDAVLAEEAEMHRAIPRNPRTKRRGDDYSAAEAPGSTRPSKIVKLSVDLGKYSASSTPVSRTPKSSISETTRQPEFQLGGIFYSLQEECRKKKPDAISIAKLLCDSASVMMKTIRATSESNQATITTDAGLQKRGLGKTAASLKLEQEAQLSSTFLGLGRMLSATLIALERLFTLPEGRKYSGVAVYEIVTMFGNILDLLNEHDRHFNVAQAPPNSLERPRRATVQEVTPTRKQSASTSTVIQFLLAVFTNLSPTHAVHNQLFEGFLYVLLDRVGGYLYLSTFGHLRKPTIEEDINSVNANQPLEQVANLPTCALPTPEYLITLLSRALSLAPRHLSLSSQPTKASRTATKTTRSSSAPKVTIGNDKASLSQTLRTRLQQTLINCTFGLDDTDEFMDCLRMPRKTVLLPERGKGDETGGMEGFKEALWGMLGWEILMRDLE